MLQSVLVGFVRAWVLCSAIVLWTFADDIHSRAVGANPLRLRYYVCDYIQVFVLFCVTYAASVEWNRFLATRSINGGFKLLLSPLFILLLAWVGHRGITPKAGKNLNAIDILVTRRMGTLMRRC